MTPTVFNNITSISQRYVACWWHPTKKTHGRCHIQERDGSANCFTSYHTDRSDHFESVIMGKTQSELLPSERIRMVQTWGALWGFWCPELTSKSPPVPSNITCTSTCTCCTRAVPFRHHRSCTVKCRESNPKLKLVHAAENQIPIGKKNSLRELGFKRLSLPYTIYHYSFVRVVLIHTA